MSISSHLEMKYPRETNMALNHAAARSLFFVTRYFVPISLSVITAALTTKWGKTVCLVPIGSVCKTVGPLELAFFNVVGIASNFLLLLRVYALYNRNKWILGYLSSIVAIQFAASICIGAFPGSGPLLLPPIDIAAFQEYAATILELIYGVSIVGLIMAKGWKDRSLNGLRDRGGVIRIMVRDSIIYFLVIFSTMFIWLCVGIFAPLGLKFVNAYLVSIMINRLTINLHRSVKGNHGTSLTPSGVQIPFPLAWMINTQDYSSSSDIDNGVIDDLGDLALSHESQGI
ncbi:hypothetical protein JB92DRAFT_2878534 [Gautieria morchelliformis]|nr:hypothetical protein JB92DRAFT_2878534 [Gautieria morchelliformis]